MYSLGFWPDEEIGGFHRLKKDALCLARDALLKLDQSVRDCSDQLHLSSQMSDAEIEKMYEAIQEADSKLRAVLKARII